MLTTPQTAPPRPAPSRPAAPRLAPTAPTCAPVAAPDTPEIAPPETDSPFAQDWWVAAACRAVPEAKDLFFSEELADMAAAKRVCAECPVIAPCLEGAIGRGEPCGVWGGQLFANGRIVTVKRRRGRPPKHPRPEDQVPMIPIPEHLQKLIA